MIIKKWFLIKNFSDDERYIIGISDDPIIERETEKAYLLKFVSDSGTIKRWVPKSVCIVEEKISSEKKEIVVGTEILSKNGSTKIVKIDGDLLTGEDGKQYLKDFVKIA